MEENEYKDNEKVLFKTKAKVNLPDKKFVEADCFITDGHVVIELEEPIKIPMLRIETCRLTSALPSASYSGQIQKPVEPVFDTITLMFLDEVRGKHKLTMEMRDGDGVNFDRVLTSAIGKAKEQWYASSAVERNWFQRHLNWTVVLTGIATYLLFLSAIFSMDVNNEALIWIAYLIGIVALFVVAGWALRQKNRSLWWLLIVFVPFGWIIFLCLENRRHVIGIL